LLSLFLILILKAKWTILFHYVYIRENVLKKKMKQKSCNVFNKLQVTND
jgi:hypothetical protein